MTNITQKAKAITGLGRISNTPESGRLTMTFSKEQIKSLKILSIELEIPVDQVIIMGIEKLTKSVRNPKVSTEETED